MGRFSVAMANTPRSHFAIEVRRCQGSDMRALVSDSFFWLHRSGHLSGSFDQSLGVAQQVANSDGQVGRQIRDRGRRTEDHVVVDALVSETIIEGGGLPVDEPLELVEHADPPVMVIT